MHRLTAPIAAVLIHVPNWREGLAWYRRAFPSAIPVESVADDWSCIAVDGVQIEVVPSDQMVSSGPPGSVVYWYADDFEARAARLKSIGAICYRGPMEIEGGWVIGQFRDPFGNLLGLRGPRITGNA
jgi:predicted enzyme related to lactoylglutathione lyase